MNKLLIELLDATLEQDLGVQANAFGLSLILYTCLVKTLIYPLYEGQLRSTARMRKVQPVMREIQRKYQNDQEKMNAEMTRMYIEEEINPLQGFATAIVQLPIFVSLYKSIIQLSEQDEHFKQSFLWIPSMVGPQYPETYGMGWLTSLQNGAPEIGWGQAALYLLAPALLIAVQLTI